MLSNGIGGSNAGMWSLRIISVEFQTFMPQDKVNEGNEWFWNNTLQTLGVTKPLKKTNWNGWTKF